MTEGKALGRSPLKEREDFLADALLSKPVTPNSESLVVNKDSAITNNESLIINKEKDHDILTQSMNTGFYNPRVSLYSPMVAAMLEYLDLTVPRFCKSDEGTRILEKAFKKNIPISGRPLKKKRSQNRNGSV